MIGGVGEKLVGWMGKRARRLVEVADSIVMGGERVGGRLMVWQNEWEVEGVARVRAKCWRNGIELVVSYRKGLVGEGEGWMGRWLRRMVEMAARGLGG